MKLFGSTCAIVAVWVACSGLTISRIGDHGVDRLRVEGLHCFSVMRFWDGIFALRCEQALLTLVIVSAGYLLGVACFPFHVRELRMHGERLFDDVYDQWVMAWHGV